MTDYSASTTLDDIINELRLSYDSSVGLLGGDHVQEVPKVSILLNLSKLLNKLNKQLQEVERTDIEVLERIVDEIGDEEAGDNGEANVTVDGDIEGKEMDQGEVVEGEEEYAVEVGKEENEGEEDEHDGMVTEDVTQDGGIEKNEGETDADNILRMKRKSNESLDTDDEDDVGLAKRRKFSKQEETSDKIDGPAISIDGAQNNNEKEREEVEGSAHGEGEDNDDDEGEGAEEEDGEEEDEEDEEGDEDNEDVDEDGNKINGDDDDEEEEEPPRFDGNGDIIPPEQKGHYTQDNDTRLKNPKSEFVTSQTLPAEAIAKLGLFSEDHNGLETQGKEYLKKNTV